MLDKSNLDIPQFLQELVESNPSFKLQLANHFAKLRQEALEDFMKVDIVNGSHESNKILTKFLRGKVDIYEELAEKYSNQ